MIKNRCKITIKALNQERILNSLSKKVDIFDLQKQQSQASFYVERKKMKTAKKALKEIGVEAISFQSFGFFERILMLLKSYGILLALAIMFVVYPLQYSLIWKVVILGGENGVGQQVQHCVKNNVVGRLKWKINTKELENQLRSDFEEISSVSVAIVGQSLVVSINQKTIPEEMKDGFLPIVSGVDARVESVSLVQGTLAVKQGDVVKKGQVLVHPFIIDSQGEKRSCQPKADIIASVWIEGRAVCYDSEIVTKRTGKKFLKREVFLNNVLIYSSNSKHDFSSFEEEVCWQNLSTNNLLPLKIKRTWVFETVRERVFNDFSKIKENIMQNAREKTLIFLQKDEIIKEENYTIREEGGWHEVCCVITVERNIGG